MKNPISIKELSTERLEQLALQHPCEGNSPDDNCFICNELARRGNIPSVEEES